VLFWIDLGESMVLDLLIEMALDCGCWGYGGEFSVESYRAAKIDLVSV